MEKHDALIQEFFDRHPDLQVCAGDMRRAFSFISDCYREGGKLLLCGNGGSAADCEHIAGELMKGFLSSRTLSPEHQRLLAAQSEDGAYLAQHLQEALPLPVAYQPSFPKLRLCQRRGSRFVLCPAGFTATASAATCCWLFPPRVTPKTFAMRPPAPGPWGLRPSALPAKPAASCKKFAILPCAPPMKKPTGCKKPHECMYHLLCAALEARFFG